MTASLIIVAAGSSTRWQSTNSFEKKEFVKLKNGKTVLESSVLSVYTPIEDCIKSVIIVYKKDLLKDTKEALNYNNLHKNIQNKLVFIEGGKTRAESTRNAIKYIEENIKCSHIITHDGARPYPGEKMVISLFNLSKKHKAVIPVIPLVDTIKEIKNGFVVSTPERNMYSSVQTPQFFDAATIINAYKMCYNENDYDDSQTVSRYNEPVYTAEGEKTNIKITYRGDII